MGKSREELSCGEAMNLVFSGGRESIAWQSISQLKTLWESPVFYMKHMRHIKKDAEPQPVEVSQAYSTIRGYCRSIAGENQKPESTFRPHQSQWMDLMKQMESYLPDGVDITPIVTTQDEVVQMYAADQERIYTIMLTPSTPISETLERVQNYPQLSLSDLPSGSSLSEQIETYVTLHGHGRVFRLEPDANEFRHFTHELFSREGKTIQKLRESSVYHIGELQSLLLALNLHGIKYDSSKEKVVIQSDMQDAWVHLRTFTDGQDHVSQERKEYYIQELTEFALNRIYYESALIYVKKCPELVNEFLRNGNKKILERYHDFHLASGSQTKQTVAENMIAQWLTARYEETYFQKDFISCRLKKQPEFMAEMWEFLNARHELAGTLLDSLVEQTPESAISSLGVAPNYCEFTCSDADFRAIVADAEMALERDYHEKERQEKSRKLIAPLMESLKLVDNDSGNLRTIAVIIGSLLLAKKPDSREVTMSYWFPKSDYYPDGHPLTLPTPEESFKGNLTEVMWYIFNGSGGADEQAERIRRAAPSIIRELTDPDNTLIPENYRRFVKKVTGADFGTHLMGKEGPIWDNDPLVVDSFHEDFKEYQLSVLFQVVHDFTRGFETFMILDTGSIPQKVGRMTFDNWKNQDFTYMDKRRMNTVISKTAQEASRRLDKLNHRTRMSWTCVKDVQEFLEEFFLNQFHETAYVQHTPHFDEDTSVGPNSECPCPRRKSWANSMTLKTY